MGDLYLADVSRYQGAVDWAAYGRWSGAAICKATQGTLGVDRQFPANQAGMRKHLVVRGFYHFLTDEDVAAQARHFANEVGFLRPGEFAVLDVEQTTGHARHEAFCAEVDRHVGGLCWLYGGSQVRTSRPVWVARYRDYTPDPAGEPSIPHVLWQYTDRGRCPGVDGNVDLNVHRGDLASLARFAKQEEDDVALSDEDVERIVDRWQEKYGERLAQWIGGKENAVYRSVNLDNAPVPNRLAISGGADVSAVGDALAARLAARLSNG